MEPRRLHTRLIALVVGAVAALAAVAAVFALLPSQGTVDENVDYGYVYSGAKSSSTAFIDAAVDDDTLIMLGSSEFSTPARLVPQVPARVFGETDYGLHLMLVGEAFDQSLWHTIALGALAADGGVPNDKVALIVAPGWFVDGGQDPSTFQTRFSYSLYREFCANPQVPEQAREYVAGRLLEMGVGATEVESGAGSMPQDRINALALSLTDDLKLRSQLGEVREKGVPRAEGPATQPDWDALREEALADAAERTASNDWGLEDEFYTQQLAPALDQIAGARAGETYSDTPEYDDLDCLLDVADACGIEVLVIVNPECGPYYDHIGIDEQTRRGCYDRILQVCAAHECAQVADFSDREYEKWFLFDIVHFGWLGWIDVEHAVYDFAMGGGA